MSEARTNDATKAIVEVRANPARSYANEQETLSATAKQQARDEQKFIGTYFGKLAQENLLTVT